MLIEKTIHKKIHKQGTGVKRDLWINTGKHNLTENTAVTPIYHKCSREKGFCGILPMAKNVTGLTEEETDEFAHL